MEEQTNTPAEAVESIAAVPAESQPKRAKRKTKTPRTTPAASAEKDTTSKPTTDEEKRLAKNTAVRVWRAANKDRFAEYMKNWRDAKKAKDKKATKATTKKAKRIGKAATA